MLQKQVHREAFHTAASLSSSCAFLQHSQTTFRYRVISLHILDLQAYFGRRLNHSTWTTHSWLLSLWQNHSSSCTPQVLLNPRSSHPVSHTEAIQPAGKTRLRPIAALVYKLIPSLPITCGRSWRSEERVVWELLSVAQLSLHFTSYITLQSFLLSLLNYIQRNLDGEGHVFLVEIARNSLFKM